MASNIFAYNYRANLDTGTQTGSDNMYSCHEPKQRINPKYDHFQYGNEEIVLSTSTYKAQRSTQNDRSRGDDHAGLPSFSQLSPHMLLNRRGSKDKAWLSRKRSITLMKEAVGVTHTSNNFDLASHHIAWFDHEEAISMILRHERNSKTEELLCSIDTLREVQIRLVVSIALHELPSKRLFDTCLRSPSLAIEALRSFTDNSEREALQKLSRLYVEWWRTAHNCNGTDVIRGIVEDLLLNPIAVSYQQQVFNDALSKGGGSKLRLSKNRVKTAVRRTSSMVHSVAKASKKAVRTCRQRSHPDTRQNSQRRASIRLAHTGRRTPDPEKRMHSRSSCPALMQDSEVCIYTPSIRSESSSDDSTTNYAFSEAITDTERDYFDWLSLECH